MYLFWHKEHFWLWWSESFLKENVLLTEEFWVKAFLGREVFFSEFREKLEVWLLIVLTVLQNFYLNFRILDENLKITVFSLRITTFVSKFLT